MKASRVLPAAVHLITSYTRPLGEAFTSHTWLIDSVPALFQISQDSMRRWSRDRYGRWQPSSHSCFHQLPTRSLLQRWVHPLTESYFFLFFSVSGKLTSLFLSFYLGDVSSGLLFHGHFSFLSEAWISHDISFFLFSNLPADPIFNHERKEEKKCPDVNVDEGTLDEGHECRSPQERNGNRREIKRRMTHDWFLE